MCGIIGYIGNREAPPILLEGLKKLEYRGYDSSGIGVVDTKKSKVIVRKMPGKIKNLEAEMKSRPFPSATIGISHTRWATHGAPNKANSHPHNGASGRITIVHNGIIENYENLRDKLKKKGRKFLSETDTEVVAQLIDSYYKNDLYSAVQKAIKELDGAFALGVISADHPDELIAARIGSPLIIGVGKNENFIASDAPAIMDRTRNVIYLKDGQMARITRDKISVSDFEGNVVKPKVDKITYKIDAVQKQGYPHYMLKEVHEQPEVLRQMFKNRLKGDDVYLEGLGLSDAQLKGMKKVFIVACGTAFHAGLVGKYIIEAFSGVRVSIEVSSEFRYRDPIVDKKTLVIAVSQSGETADTLAAVREAKSKGAKVISICNVIGSSLSRESDGVLYTHAGPEIGVASTKAYTAQLAMFYLFAIKMGRIHKFLDPKIIQGVIKDLKRLPGLFDKTLKTKTSIARISRANAHFGCFLFLGRNINYPTAMEGALKLKEISYVPAEGYAAGEMKHGPIALIDEYRAVVCIAVQSPTYEKMISNIEEIKSRKGKVIAIATEGDKSIKKHAQHVIYIPSTNEWLTPLLAAIPLQLIAYYIADKRGCDVDQPRNLAKSVTVE